MSARHGQGVATWLIMLPLLIVPLIAVFGVPQLTPMSAQTADGADGDKPGLEFELGDSAPLAEAVPPFPGGSIEQLPPSESTAERWSDPFENPTEWMEPNTSGADSRISPSPSTPDKGFGKPFDPPREPDTRTPRNDVWTQPQPEHLRADSDIEEYSRTPDLEENSINTPAPLYEPAAQLTWRAAVARLNKLGVQKFQLSQTEEPFVFQFVCDLSRPDNPRVTHRFEAKAGEPLKAVENVIQQVQTWSAQQASH